MSDRSSEPFTAAECKLIVQYADRRSEWDGRLVRVMLTFGLHPSVLSRTGDKSAERNEQRVDSDMIFRRPTERGDRLFFRWIRAKVTATKQNIEVEVPQTMDWLPTWLNEERPETRQGYNWRLHLIERDMLADGYDIHLNPRRFRHTCANAMLAKGFTPTDVRNALGVSPSVMDMYAASTPEMRGRKGEEVGWGIW